jgi:hypothetical protein
VRLNTAETSELVPVEAEKLLKSAKPAPLCGEATGYKPAVNLDHVAVPDSWFNNQPVGGNVTPSKLCDQIALTLSGVYFAPTIRFSKFDVTKGALELVGSSFLSFAIKLNPKIAATKNTAIANE